MYDADGKFVGEKTQTIKLTTMKDVRVEMTNDNGNQSDSNYYNQRNYNYQTFEGTEGRSEKEIKALK